MGANIEYSPVIGLEIHVQLSTKSKLFCSCSTDYIGAEPNSNTCPVCLGLPGSLPVLNKKALEYALKIALGLNCKINNFTRFHRKNYFYPDLPKAYQISQYDIPLAEKGKVELLTKNGEKTIRITRAHMEEDAGKLVHPTKTGRLEGATYSLVDYNRAGVPLVEIVTEPDISSPQEAKEFVSLLRQLVRYLGVSDGDMEKGSLRVDANISVRLPDGTTTNKTEVKNLNSLKALEKALEYEFKRQVKLVKEGKEIIRETRHWDDKKEETFGMRSKEQVHDYRYFPEPDLLPIIIPQEMIQQAEKDLPELPWEAKQRLKDNYNLNDEEIHVLTERAELLNYFDQVIKHGADPHKAASWIKSELLGLANEKGKPVWELGISPENFAELLNLHEKKEISTPIAKELLTKIIETQKTPSQLIKELGLKQLDDEDLLQRLAQKVISENPKTVEQYKKGKTKSLNFLVGQIMKETKGRANPQKVREILIKTIENPE